MEAKTQTPGNLSFTQAAYRQKLINTFWLIANKHIGGANAFAMLKKLHGGKTIQNLTNEELQKAIQALINRHNLDVKMPRKHKQGQKPQHQPKAQARKSSKDIPDKQYRLKLIKTFWLIAHQITEENARAVVESMYKSPRISILQTYQLEAVVAELIRTSGLDIGMPNRQAKASNDRFNQPPPTPGTNLREDATPQQMALINQLANDLDLPDSVLVSQMEKMNRADGNEGPLSLRAAQNLIEGFKKMKKRNWQPKNEPVWQGKVGNA